jgi:pimeloyl-ACP methyl ester carboxylesterase
VNYAIVSTGPKRKCIFPMITMSECFLKSKDGERIALNHYDQKRDSVIIICHGWAMCKDSKVFKGLSEDLFKHHDIITLDFRGHGQSSGSFTFTAKEPQDLEAVVAFAKTRYKKVTLMGFSLGSAISIIHAASHKDVENVIAVSAPVSFEKIENEFYRKEAFIPSIKKFEFWRSFTIRPGNLFLPKTNPIDVVEHLEDIPILFLSGGKDRTIHAWHGTALHEKATSPSEHILFEDDFHAEDLYLSSPRRFVETCIQWISKHTR